MLEKSCASLQLVLPGASQGAPVCLLLINVNEGTYITQSNIVAAICRSRLLQQSAPKRVAYQCAYGDLCGGLGDHLKGFASTFILALLLDAEFVVEWTYPVSSTHLIAPCWKLRCMSGATHNA